MILDRKNLAQEWLAAEGDFRKEATREAACFLLSEYLTQWGQMVPVELHRVAATLHARIFRLVDFKGEALLLPEKGGFRVLVNASVRQARYRTSIAHELAHTLFYTSPVDESMPKKFTPDTESEEKFCFEVARHLLAPREHLEAIGVFQEKDPAVIFGKLTGKLLLSRVLAAKVMFADYALVTGVAGRWVRSATGWKLINSSATATPSLSRRDRKELRMEAIRYLQFPDSKPHYQEVVAVKEASGNGAFILITTR